MAVKSFITLAPGIWEEGSDYKTFFHSFLQKQNMLECFSIPSRIRLAMLKTKEKSLFNNCEGE